jgi:hypothetical protein
MQSKAELYEVLWRNGLKLPSLISSAVCEEYPNGDMQERYFCPELVDIRIAPCFTIPTKHVLIGKLFAIA